MTLSSRPYEALVDVPFRVMAMDLTWATRKEAEDSITVLLRYMGRASGEYWRFVRAWRVMNVLQSALPGANEEATRVIRSTLKAVERDYNKYIWVQPRRRHPRGTQVKGPFKKWNWTTTRRQLSELAKRDAHTFARLLRQTEERLSTRRHNAEIETKFLRLMRDIDFDRETK